MMKFFCYPNSCSYDSRSKKWLQEKYTLSFLSSEKIFPYLSESLIDLNKSIFGFGNPALSKKTISNDLDELFNTRGEIDINEIFFSL